MERSITLRSALPEDQEFLFGVYASSREEEMSLWGWDDNQKRGFLELQWRAKNDQYNLSYPQADDSVVLLNGRPIGRMMFDRAGPDFTFLDIALLPEYQNQNIGTRLIELLQQEATAAQKSVVLHVLRTNRAARLYERMGFKMVNEDGIYREMKWTPGEDRA
ncbi:MAG TPA: GNAT family N-acetyltransferase [Pyrinomonadaceae bacterium]|nr:GNAT family N-acetyltransferase [Pyrinomonadaceae bacterium]